MADWSGAEGLGLVLFSVPIVGYVGMGVRWVLERVTGKQILRG